MRTRENNMTIPTGGAAPAFSVFRLLAFPAMCLLALPALCLLSPAAQAQCSAPRKLDWVGTNGRPGGQMFEEPVRTAMVVDADGNCGLAGAFFHEADLDPTEGVVVLSPMGYEDGAVHVVSADQTSSRIGILGSGYDEGCQSVALTGAGDWRYCGSYGFNGGGEYCGDMDPYENQALYCSSGRPGRFGAYVTYVHRDGSHDRAVLLAGDYEIGGTAVTGLPDGGIALTSYFRGSVDLDPGPGEYIVVEEGEGQGDAYLLALDEHAEFMWAVVLFGGEGFQEGEHLTTDAFGNIYWTGRFSDAVDFDPGPREEFHWSQSGSDLFVCKYTSHGQYLWTRTLNTNTGHLGLTVVPSNDGRIVISNAFRGRTDFDPTNGVDQREAAGQSDAFVTVWTGDGDYLWTATWGGPGYDGAHAAFDSRGDLIVGGNFSATVDFDPGPGQDVRTSLGGNDSYVARYGRDGTYLCALQFGGPDSDSVGRIAVNSRNDDIWLDGLFMGIVDFDPGPGEAFRTSVGERDLFLMKMTCDGRGCEELTGHSASGRTGSVESRVSTTLSGGKAVIKLEGDALRFKQKARLAGDGSGSTTFRNLPPGRYRVTVAKLKTAEGTRVCNGALMERFVEVK